MSQVENPVVWLAVAVAVPAGLVERQRETAEYRQKIWARNAADYIILSRLLERG